MTHQRCDFSQKSVRLVKNAQLPQDSSSVVVDFFAGKMVVCVECVDSTQRQLYRFSRCREAAPCSEMRAANHDLEDDRLLREVAPRDFNLRSGRAAMSCA
jgi:hypothetical protein